MAIHATDSLSQALDSLPVLCGGEHLGDDRGWTFPKFEGNAAFWVRGYNGENPRKIARLDGKLYVRWPGFGWTEGEY
jgi:hypothetical protein